MLEPSIWKAGGNEFGLGVGRDARKAASGVREAITTDSDRGIRKGSEDRPSR